MTAMQSNPNESSACPSKGLQSLELRGSIERFLCGRVLDVNATAAVELLLFDRALRHDLVYAGRRVADSLSTTGLSVQVQYCTSTTHGHPIPFLIVRDESGEVVIPNSIPRDIKIGGSEIMVVDCGEAPCGERRLRTSQDHEQPTLTRRKAAIVVIPCASKRSSSQD